MKLKKLKKAETKGTWDGLLQLKGPCLLLRRHQAISKANKMIGMLKNTFINRDIKLWKQLHTPMIRPHLECVIQVWSPYQIGDIDIVERVERRVAKIPKYPDGQRAK